MIGNIETDLEKIKKLAKENEEENWEFRSFLKWGDYSSGKIDKIVYDLTEKVSAKIDCAKCGNCCKEVRPVLSRSDIGKFSKGLNISAARFKKQYLVKCDEESGFCFKTKPCPFLKDNRCSHYSLRPAACESYPHLHKKDFVLRLMGVIENYAICPIVFNVYEKLKSKLWHERAAADTLTEKEDNHSWDLNGSEAGNLDQNEDAGEEKFNEWQKRNWMKWLEDNLSFPFMAERVEDDDDAYLNHSVTSKLFRLGHTMKVLTLADEDGLYGIIVKVREERKVGYVPLSDLEVLSRSDRNYWPVREYSAWFANR